jgi:hypothetical protein
MADQKVSSNGYTDIWLVPAAGIADPNVPTAAEINAGVRVTPAVAWDGTTFPAAQDSDDIDDRSLEDVGNATGRGAQTFQAVLNLFYPLDKSDLTNDYGKAYNALKIPGATFYLITRVLQRTAAPGTTPATAGDWISVYKGIADGWSDDIQDDDSYKYAITFLPQGVMKIYTQVKGTTLTASAGSSTLASASNAKTTVRALLNSKEATQSVVWSTSDPTKATVTQNGVVTAISAGSVTISAGHPAATAAATVDITVT